MRERNPEVPCANLVGMRHRLVHAYFDINLDILWATAVTDAPQLLTLISGLLDRE